MVKWFERNPVLSVEIGLEVNFLRKMYSALSWLNSMICCKHKHIYLKFNHILPLKILDNANI